VLNFPLKQFLGSAEISAPLWANVGKTGGKSFEVDFFPF
jgi:hypothetical protein